MMDPNYFVSKIQLRNSRPEVEDFIEEEVRKAGPKKAFISKKERITSGYDYYLSSNSFALDLGNKLSKKFGGELKASRRLFGRDHMTSKDLYRVSVYFSPFPFANGEAVKIFGKIVTIGGMSGKKVSGINLLTGKKELFDMAKIDPQKIAIEKAVVVKTHPEIEVTGLDSFETMKLHSSPESLKKLKGGQNIKIAVDNGIAYLLKG